MKRIKVILLTAVVCSVCVISNAQFKRVGIKTGLNISSARATNGLYAEIGMDPKFNNSTGAAIGFLSQTSKNDIFVTDFGFNYTLKGFSQENLSLKMHYLQIPLVFKIRIPIAGPVAIQGGFGPYFSYAFLAKQTEGGRSSEDILSIRKKKKDGFITTGDLNPYSPFDAGMIFGGDVEIRLPNQALLLVGFNYELGTASISNEQPSIEEPVPVGIEQTYFNPGLKNNNMQITLTYLFDVGAAKAE